MDASLCAQTAIIYSILAPFCTEKEKATYREGIKKMAFVLYGANWLTLDTLAALDSMGHNWWLVIVCAGGFAALALKDEDDRMQFPILKNLKMAFTSGLPIREMSYKIKGKFWRKERLH